MFARGDRLEMSERALQKIGGLPSDSKDLFSKANSIVVEEIIPVPPGGTSVSHPQWVTLRVDGKPYMDRFNPSEPRRLSGAWFVKKKV
jgi:hypothetical protein